MSRLLIITILVFCHLAAIAQVFKLNTPIVSDIKVMLKSQRDNYLSYDFRQEGAQIYYALPNKNKFTRYKKPIAINKSGIVRAFVSHSDFINSDTITTHLFKKSTIPYKVSINTAHPKYGGSQTSIINDNAFGNSNFKQNYLGYDGEEIDIVISLDKLKPAIKGITASILVSKGAWIFGPSSIAVVGADGTVVYSKQYEANQFDDGYVLLTIPIKSKENEYRLKIKPTTLPDWHQGAGKLAWLFIDEIFVE